MRKIQTGEASAAISPAAMMFCLLMISVDESFRGTLSYNPVAAVHRLQERIF